MADEFKRSIPFTADIIEQIEKSAEADERAFSRQVLVLVKI